MNADVQGTAKWIELNQTGNSCASVDIYHFLWNFTCHFVNKAYAKIHKNIFYFICTLRITEQKLNLPSRLEKKAHGKKHGAQRIVVGFVVKAQRIVGECLRLDSGLPIITTDFA